MKNITVFLDSYKNEQGKQPVYLRVRLQNKYVKETTGIFVDAAQFDTKNGTLRKSVKDAEQLNMIIREKVSKANRIFIKYELAKVELTKEIFASEFKRETEDINLIKWLRDKIEERYKHKEIAKSTYNHDLSTVNILETFRPQMLFSDINEKMIKDFRRFMIANNSAHNTVVKHLKRIKLYFTIASDEKIISENEYFRFENLTSEDTEPGWITEEQKNYLIEVYNSDILFEKLMETAFYKKRDPLYARNQQISYKKVIRWFLFSCETGLRISDIFSITFEDLKDNVLIFTPVKTKRTKLRDKTVRVPLTMLAKEIIKHEKPMGFTGKIFSTYKEQVINRYLKVIFTLLNIKINVGEVHFHCARHTFGSLLYKKTKNLVLVQKMMGHSKIEQTMVYVRLHPDEMIHEFLQKFDNRVQLNQIE